VTVVSGGKGYAAGAFTVESETGAGLAGACLVDEQGRIEKVTLTAGGAGYPDPYYNPQAIVIKCARADNAETEIPEEDRGVVVVESAGYLSQHVLFGGASWRQVSISHSHSLFLSFSLSCNLAAPPSLFFSLSITLAPTPLLKSSISRRQETGTLVAKPYDQLLTDVTYKYTVALRNALVPQVTCSLSIRNIPLPQDMHRAIGIVLL